MLVVLITAVLLSVADPSSVPAVEFAPDGDVESASPGSPPGPADHGPSSPELAPPALPCADVTLVLPHPVRLAFPRRSDGAPSPGWVLRIERPPRRAA